MATAKTPALTPAVVQYFEFISGSSNKFWEISVTGASFTTRYAKIGTEGKTTTKRFASHTKAQREAGKLVEEKTSKGYTAG